MTAATNVTCNEGEPWRPSAALRVAVVPSQKRSLAVTLMAAISAFTLILVSAGPASAAAASVPETVVAAQTDPTGAGVGAEDPLSPAFVGPNSVYGYDGMLGCCVAPRTGSVNSVRGRHNCTSCVIAGDSTLAGSPASAVDLYPGRPIPGGSAAVADFAGGSWRSVTGRSAIERQLLDAGDGARGIVYGTDGVDAHVWNAVVQNGKVNFVDFQGIGPNGPAAFDAWDSFAFVRTN